MSVNGIDFSRSESNLTFRILKALAGIYSRVFHQITLRHGCELPKTGPAILVCNHTSSIDPIFLQAYCGRKLRWMMAKEYFEIKSMRWLYNAVGVILVERSGRDLASTRAAMRALASGCVLVVFPEGKIETGEDLIPFQSGIGLLAIKTRAPVYPVYLDGSQRNLEMVEAFFTPSDVSITFGAPLRFDDLKDSKSSILEATRRIQSAVESLKNGSQI